MITRRDFLKYAGIAGAAATLPLKFGVRTAHAVANTIQLTKWAPTQKLRGLNAGIAGSAALNDSSGIPVMSSVADPVYTSTRYYQVTAGEFIDFLHPQLPGGTRLWGYWDTTAPVKKHLGGVIIATRGTASRIRFTNALDKTAEGGAFPGKSIIPVDTTIPGADAGAGENRIAVHLHGGFVPWISDGGPFDWWAPNGTPGLSFKNGPTSLFDNIATQPMVPGQADYFYPNDQSTRLMWYHDHAHGITRTNAYAGVATGYLLIDPTQETALAGKIPSLLSTVPLVFQDKVFVDPVTIGVTDPTWATVARADVQSLGSLWYEHVYDPKLFRLKKNAPLVGAIPNPSCIPEFFGDTMLVNGTVYPYLEVEPKPYRFIMLNACNARFLNINLLQVAVGGEVATNPKTLFANLVTNPAGPTIWQIGTEGGYLVAPAQFPNNLPFNPATFTGNMLIAPAERADFIIDFTGKNGLEYVMYNDAPGPFPAGPPTTDYFLGNPKNPIQPAAGTGPDTRNIFKIKVLSVTPTTAEPIPSATMLNTLNPTLDPPPIVAFPTNAAIPVPVGGKIRPLTLNEDFDLYGRLRQLIGTTTIAPAGGFGLEYLQPATEIVPATDPVTLKPPIEYWQVFNLTADTHPIHFHLVNVQILSRQPFRLNNGRFNLAGVARGPLPQEQGWKETVQMHPGEVTTCAMQFFLPTVPFNVPLSTRFATQGIPGAHEYVYHCHILEHEEHDMMRPLVITP